MCFGLELITHVVIILTTIEISFSQVTVNFKRLTFSPVLLKCVNGFTTVGNNGTVICNVKDELDCIFPFKYKQVWYDTCIDVDFDSGYWCSLDSVYSGRFVTCLQKCPLLAAKLTVSEETHTSCLEDKYPHARSFTPLQSEIDTILRVHNDYRSKVYPTASDMHAIEWNNGLARLAQKYSDQCKFGHDCANCRKLLNNSTLTIGQNIYAVFSRVYKSNFWTNVLLNSWGAEHENYIYNQGSRTGNIHDVIHYIQMINSNTTKIGCGATQCGDYIHAYCNYANGELSIKKPYKNGSICSKCKKSSICIKRLCYPKKLENSEF